MPPDQLNDDKVKSESPLLDNEVSVPQVGVTVVDGATQDNDDDVSESSKRTASKRCLCFSEKQCKTLFGLVIISGIAVSWVGATQFAKQTYDPSLNFDGPFMFTWFATCWMIVCFPFYLLTHVVSQILHPCSKSRRGGGRIEEDGAGCSDGNETLNPDVSGNYSSVNVSNQHIGGGGGEVEVKTLAAVCKDAYKIYGDKGLTIFTFITRTFLFCLIWLLTNYMYLKALSIITSSDVTALFASNTAFVYLLSWVFLREKFVSLRLLSVCLSVSGVVLIAYAESMHGLELDNLTGVTLALLSAATAASYQVLFKRVMGETSGAAHVSLFLTMLGLTCLLLMAPVVVLLYFTQSEIYDWYNMPWTFLVGSSALQLVFNFLVNFGVAFTFPLFIAVGTVLGIPLNAAVDVLLRGVDFTPMKIAATALICLGFCCMLIPPDWQKSLTMFCTCIKNEEQELATYSEEADRRLRPRSRLRAAAKADDKPSRKQSSQPVN